MKAAADNNKNVKVSNFKIGDTVFVKQPKQNKLTSPFNPVPHMIVTKKGTMIAAKSSIGIRWITRYSSFF